jgi:hypothetical protein
MRTEALTRLDEILVHYPQGAKSHMIRILVRRKRKRVMRFEPTVISVTAIRSFAHRDHCLPPLEKRHEECLHVIYIFKKMVRLRNG